MNNYNIKSDHEIIKEIQNGDKAIFNVIIDRYYQKINKYLFRMTGSRESSEDLTQETFIRVYNSIGSYKPEASFNVWIYKIATNLSITYFQRVKSKEPKEFKDEYCFSDSLDPQNLSLKKEMNLRVRKAIDRLPERQKVAIILAKYEELSSKEIGDLLKLKDNAVNALLHRAIDNLSKYLFDLKSSESEKKFVNEILRGQS